MNLSIPLSIEGVDSKLLNPINTWDDKEEYKKYLNELVDKFQDNFKRFNAKPEIIAAGPDLMANDSFTSVLVKLKEKEFFKNLVIKRGIEKEFFRVDENGNISNNFTQLL